MRLTLKLHQSILESTEDRCGGGGWGDLGQSRGISGVGPDRGYGVRPMAPRGFSAPSAGVSSSSVVVTLVTRALVPWVEGSRAGR